MPITPQMGILQKLERIQTLFRSLPHLSWGFQYTMPIPKSQLLSSHFLTSYGQKAAAVMGFSRTLVRAVGAQITRRQVGSIFDFLHYFR